MGCSTAFSLLLFSLFAIAQSALVDLQWSIGCGPDYDYCGDIYYCSSNTQAYGYRMKNTECASPGPTFRVVPGKSYQITLHHENHRDWGSPTNLHTHGLHIPGDGNADDVTRTVDYGMCLTYNWTIPSDHLGGTHWYHAHAHGFTNTQVKEGALGFLIVEDFTRKDDDLLRFTCPAGSGMADWMKNEQLLFLSAEKGEANGEANPTIEVVSAEWFRLRVAYFHRQGRVDALSIGGGRNARMSCEWVHVASDGVWHPDAFGAPLEIDSKSVSVSGSGRVDLAVRCNATAQGDSSAGVFMGNTLYATLEAMKSQPDTSIEFDNSCELDYPDYLSYDSDRFHEEVFEVSMGANNINNVRWEASRALRAVEFNSKQMWVIIGSLNHPFHLHLYHFQMLRDCGIYKAGRWYDSVSEKPACRVGFKTADIGGRVVMHCHNLAHEDNGAMTWMDVRNAPPVPTTGRSQDQCPPSS